MDKAGKQQDANSSLPPKPEYRGLVICPPVTINGEDMHIRQTWLDAQELRFSLLFWDRLSWPIAGGINIQGGTDEVYLEQCGILERPRINVSGRNGQLILNAQIAAYQAGEEKAPGAWAIAQGDNSLLVKGGIGEVGKGALIELIRAIPIPARDVPLQEILELKERRRDELLRFRFHLELLAEQVSSSLEPTAALQQQFNEVNEACSDLVAIGKDWQFPMRISSFKTSLNLKPALVEQVMGAWEIGEKWSVEVGAIAAAATGLYRGIKIETDFGIRSPKLPTSPYRYAYRIHSELP